MSTNNFFFLFFVSVIIGLTTIIYQVNQQRDLLIAKVEDLQVTPTPTPQISISDSTLWILINEWRLKNNHKRLTHDWRLCPFAQARMRTIKTDWSHQEFIEMGDSWRMLLGASKLGENLARDFSNPDDMLAAWLDSPSHLANLEEDYTHSCVVTDGGYGVQMFAKY